MKGLVSVGALLIVVWLAALVIFKVAGFLIHLILLVGLVMLVLGLIRRAGGRSTS